MVGGAAVLLAVVAIAGAVLGGVAGDIFPLFLYQTAGVAITLGLVGMAAARRGTVHAGVWVTTIAGLLMGMETAGGTLAMWLMRAIPGAAEALSSGQLSPSQLPTGAAIAMFAERTWVASLGGFLTLGLLLFPNGKLPSRRWRWAVATSVAGIALFTVGNFIAGWPTSEIPWNLIEPTTVPGVLMTVGMPLVGISILAAIASLVLRHRHAGAEQRHQVRWMLYGAGMFGAVFVTVFAVFSLIYGPGAAQTSSVLNITSMVILPMLLVSYGMGVVKYRLYEIDVVIRRSLVFGALAAFITGVYVAIVVGLGSLLGDRSSTALAVAATALVAVAFEPVRQRVQRWANRMVYGIRATPYEVLASMSAPEAAVDNLIAESASVVAAGLGAEAVVVWGDAESGREAVSVWPPEWRGSSEDGWDAEVPMLHEGQHVGSVAVRMKRGDNLTSQGGRLLHEFAGQTSLLMANALLNQRLARRLEELSESRRRLVAAQDEARRRLERDLHDGAQQELVALKVKLGLARSIATKEGAEDVAELLAATSSEADEAVEALRDLARGIYPPLLESEGLAAAINAQVRKSGLPVDLDVTGLGRYERGVEAAVYFCVLEALDNVARHSSAGQVALEVVERDGYLDFTVTDDGKGFDQATTPDGTGLAAMRDRLDTMGGVFDVASRPRAGTTITASIPLEDQNSFSRIRSAP